MVNVNAVIDMVRTQIGQSYSGTYDTHNGNHPWAYWCLALCDSTHSNLGLNVPRYRSALEASYNYPLQGGRAPYGSVMFFGTSFYYPDGHAMVSLGDGTGITTLTSYEGVGIKAWNEHTNGYLGWAYYAGVDTEEDEIDDVPPISWYVQPNNPYQVANQPEIGIGGGFLRYYRTVSLSQEIMTVLGFARDREYDATVQDMDGTIKDRVVQSFQRGTLIYQAENSFPWDIVMALKEQIIVPK